MTSFERTQQPLFVFEHAGRIAFAMQIPKTNNPYAKTDRNGVAEPSNLAWDRGYQAATDEAFQHERPAKPVERRPFKRASSGPKFSPRAVDGKSARPANHPRWKGSPLPPVSRAN